MLEERCIQNAMALMLLYDRYEYEFERTTEWCELRLRVNGSKKEAMRVKENILKLGGTLLGVQWKRNDEEDHTILFIFYSWQ